jgi:hypothetical protein
MPLAKHLVAIAIHVSFAREVLRKQEFTTPHSSAHRNNVVIE